MAVAEAATPATKSKLSPGKTNPIKSPVSTKRTVRMPTIPSVVTM
jgi:hypothetical protein